MEQQTRFIRLRGIAAVALTLGFYASAIGIALGLLYIPYAEVVYANTLHIRLALLCLAGAGLILWAIFPRGERFVSPGPRLEASAAPRLFDLIRSVATQTGQREPAEVYLLGEMNAFVTEVGGFLDWGKRRVMGLGLPLLQVLDQDELKSVIAHEFGHYHGGDTAIGPWVHKTRAAIGRTIISLAKANNLLAYMISLPFQAYGQLFMYITQAISRYQEFVADRLAAQVAGPGKTIQALRTIHGAAPAFRAYINQEYEPALKNGLRPPLGAGFSTFLSAEVIQEQVNRIIVQQETEGASDKFDSHPSLRERVEMLERLPGMHTAPPGAPAAELLGKISVLENALLMYLMGPDKFHTLREAPWTVVNQEVPRSRWLAVQDKFGFLLEGEVLSSLPGWINTPGPIQQKMASQNMPLQAEHVAPFSKEVAFSLFSLALLQQGWTIQTDVGQPLHMQKGEQHINLQELLEQGVSTPAAFKERLAALGIEDIRLPVR